MARLVLGPILRHVGADDATVWVETDGPCTVEVLGHRARTFTVDGHHYALVVVEGLDSARAHPYEVALDGERAWPAPGSSLPQSVIRPVRPDERLRLVFGSCRTSLPHEPPWLQADGPVEHAHGIDALRALARAMAAGDMAGWPDHLLMLGDQIYADQLSPHMRDVIRRCRPGGDRLDGGADRRPRGARSTSGRQSELALRDFSEFAAAYHEAWGVPEIRWMLSVLPSSMIFDDHEIHAEWKISRSWLADMRARSDYDRRIVGGLASYWVYQHLGNLSPAEVRADEVYRAVCEADDGTNVLCDLAVGSDRQAGRSRWSFCRDLGRTRLVVVDSRAGRELGERRRMISPEEWRWIEERAEGDFDHLLLASSVPFFLVQGLHDLEVFVEAVCRGVWGRRAARAGERVRRAAVLDHWPMFGRSFDELLGLLEHLTTGGGSGRRPHSVILLSGDVHHCYLASVELARAPGHVPLWQAVCSPYRKQLRRRERVLMRFGASRGGFALGRALARVVGAPRRPVRWRLVEQPSYDNQLGVLTVDGATAHLRVATTVGSSWRDPALHTRFEHRLA